MKPDPPQPTSAPRAAAEQPAVFERILFFVLLAALCVRPLIAESFERLELSFLPAGGGTTPVTSVWLDALTLTAATAILARGWGRWRRGRWALIGVLLLALAVAVSVVAAGDKRLALNAGFSLLIAVLAAAALVQAMRARWMPRLLLAAALASGCTTATKCIIWKTYELDTTLAYWKDYKQALAASGEDVDAPTIVNFDRRLQSGEAVGYQAHPNVAGSMLMMWLLATAGLLLGWLVDRRRAPHPERPAATVLCVGVCVLLAIGLWLTGSTGAFVALAVGALLLVLFGVGARRIARRAGRATAALAAVYVVIIAAAAVYGVSRGTLPHPSLAFRWYYWTTSAKIVQEAPLTGVGRLNFAEAYLQNKPAEATEEVRDPHNLWLSLLTELGPLGLLAGVVLIAGGLRGALRGLERPAPARQSHACVSAGQLVAAAVWVLLLHAVFAARIVSSATALLWTVECAAVWTLSLVLAARLLDRLPDSPAARAWLSAGVAAALAAALVHALIDFALLTPGGLCLFVALTAAAVGLRSAGGGVGTGPARVAPALVGMLVVIAHLATVTVPTMRSEFWLQQMQSVAFDPQNPVTYSAILDREQRALAADPLDAGAARQVATLALLIGSQADAPAAERLDLLHQAEQFGLTALARDPHSKAAHVRLATIYEEIENTCLLAAQPDQAAAAIENAATHWQAAVDLYPSNPRTRISAGRAWFHWWEESDDPAAARAAAAHFAAALQINATRLPEEVMRLREEELNQAVHYLRELEQAGFGVPTTSAPTLAPMP